MSALPGRPADPYPVRSIESLEVVRVKSIYGSGETHDPVRQVVQIFTVTGEPLVRHDEWTKETVAWRELATFTSKEG